MSGAACSWSKYIEGLRHNTAIYLEKVCEYFKEISQTCCCKTYYGYKCRCVEVFADIASAASKSSRGVGMSWFGFSGSLAIMAVAA